MKSETFSWIIFIVLVVSSLFLFFHSQFLGELKLLALGSEAIAVPVFVVILILSTVLAPLSSLPLVPLASAVYGWFPTFLYSVVGWGIGALLAFLIARQWGRPLLSKIVSIERLTKYEHRIPHNTEFFLVVLLRMVIPVDLLSYALGLLSDITISRYTLATVIGIMPFAFIFSYFGSALAERNYYEIVLTSVAGAILFGLVSYFVYRLRKN